MLPTYSAPNHLKPSIPTSLGCCMLPTYSESNHLKPSIPQSLGCMLLTYSAPNHLKPAVCCGPTEPQATSSPPFPHHWAVVCCRPKRPKPPQTLHSHITGLYVADLQRPKPPQTRCTQATSSLPFPHHWAVVCCRPTASQTTSNPPFPNHWVVCC